jgi:hypothetical protein
VPALLAEVALLQALDGAEDALDAEMREALEDEAVRAVQLENALARVTAERDEAREHQGRLACLLADYHAEQARQREGGGT